MNTEQLRKIADALPADVDEAAKDFALKYLPGVAQQFVDEMTTTDVSVPYELYTIAKGRELVDNETINEVQASEKNT
jgi:hypothetical protein